MKDFVQAKAAEFVRDAPAAYMPQLDYSVTSLEALEQILKRNVWPCKFMRARRERLMRGAGCYLFAVAMLYKGGTVTYSDELKGWFLIVECESSWVAFQAYEKVEARLSGDPSATIPLHFNNFVSAFDSLEAGAINIVV